MSAALQWDTSLKDWEHRIVARQSLIPVLPGLDTERSEKALRIFRRLRLVDVPGEPTMGQACADWVFDYVRAIFGAFNPESRRQIIREFFLLVAKKNSKSSIAAGIMLTALIMNERRQGEYLILAPTKDVADNSFGPAHGMIEADPALRRRYKSSTTTRTIENRLDEAILQVKAADADTVGGQKAIAILIDELWLFGKKASSENMLSEATGSLASRPEGFVIYLSTQSDDPPTGVFKKKLDYHRDVRDGVVIDRTSLPLLYEYPKKMLKDEAWRRPENFYIPNPSLGRSVDFEWLQSEYTKREIEGDSSLRVFIAKHLNVEIGMNLRGNRWAGADYWHRGVDPTITFERILKECEAITVGIDGGGLDDLFGLMVLGRHRETQAWMAWGHAWCHTSVLERRKSIAADLERFRDAGELTIVDDSMQDISEIISFVRKIKDSGLLCAVGIDPAGLGQLVREMAKLDLTEENKGLIGIGQGIQLMNAIKTTERTLVDGSFKHAGQQIMAWAAGNLKIEPMATAIRATKANAGDAKIDPMMALFDAIDLMTDNPMPKRKPTYEVMFA